MTPLDTHDLFYLHGTESITKFGGREDRGSILGFASHVLDDLGRILGLLGLRFLTCRVSVLGQVPKVSLGCDV